MINGYKPLILIYNFNNMLITILYIIITLAISIYYGRQRIIYYWWAFFFSFFFGPIIGISICLSSKRISHNPELYNELTFRERIMYIIESTLICLAGLIYYIYIFDKDQDSFIKVIFKFYWIPQTIFTGLIGVIIYQVRAISFSRTKSISINRQIDGLIVILLIGVFLIIMNPKIDINAMIPSSPFR